MDMRFLWQWAANREKPVPCNGELFVSKELAPPTLKHQILDTEPQILRAAQEKLSKAR